MSFRYTVAAESSSGVVVRHFCRSWLAIAFVLVTLLVAALPVQQARAALPAGCSQSGGTVTCTFTAHGESQFVVPQGLSAVTVTVVGAQGSAGYATSDVPGGLGATASGTVSVTPGGTLYAEVDALGGDGGRDNSGFLLGGPGGGESDLRTCPASGACASGTTLGSRLLVAAGGGGSAIVAGPDYGGGVGGNAGTTGAGANGQDGGPPRAGTGGTGATQSSPGIGGTGYSGGSNGGDGAFGSGGAGGGSNEHAGSAAGGGGAGWYGGGGGGGAQHGTAAGGGGGSSHAAASVSGASFSQAAAGQAPSVSLRYAVPTASITTPADGASYAHGQQVTSSFTCADVPGGPGISSCVDQNGNPSGSPVDTSTLGSHTFTVTATSQDGLTGTASVTYTVAKVSQAIAFTSTPPSPAVFGGSYTPKATGGGSGNPVVFSIDSSSAGVCSLNSSGTTVSFTGVGTCVIDANQAGNADYDAAAQQQQSFTVGKAPQTIAFTSTPPSPAVFGGSYTPTATGGGSGNPVVFSIDSSSAGVCSINNSGTTVSFTGVGTCVIDANQAGNADYDAAAQQQQSFTVGKAPQTIAFTSTPPSPAVFGGTYTPTATGGASGNPVVFSIDSSSAAGACWILNGTVAFIGPGTCVIDADQAGNANYAAAPTKQQSFTIGFTKTLSGHISTPLTVSAGQAVYLSPGTTVAAPVTVNAGGALSGQGATISGPLSGSGANAIRLCGSSVGGPVNVVKTAGLVVIGDDDGAVSCTGNKIAGPASITGGFGGVEFDDNTVGGPLTITGNTGTLPPPDTGTVDAIGNKVSGPVKIQT